MRPISLKLNAFGSYGKETLIDFTKPTQNLFLITGDTGSGKSTIFDAIVYALYGAGQENELEYQSNFSYDAKQPSVTFTFAESSEENAKQYTIIRTPKYYRYKENSKKKVLAKKPENPTVTLIENNSGNSWDKKNGAEDKIIDIVGLNRNQFMQVAMIAQGEFMNVIRESSNNKKEIFRKLFNTEIYDKIADVLGNRKKSLEKQISTIKTECQTELLNVTLNENYVKYTELREYLDILQDGNMSIINEFITLFKDYCNYLKEQYENICANNEKNNDAYEKASADLTEANQILVAFVEYENAEKTLAQCNEQKEAIAEKESLLNKINDAYVVKPYYNNYVNAENAKKDLENKINIQEKSLPELQSAFKNAENKLKEIEPLFENAKKEFTEISSSVNSALKIFEQKEKIGKEIESIKEQYIKVVDLKTKEEKEIESINNLLKENNEIKENYKNANVEKAQLDTEIKECKAIVEKNQNIENIQSQIKELQEECTKKQREFTDCQEQYNAVNGEYERINNLFLSEQAGVLAKELKDGEPCKVCGSTVHPKPYVSNESIEIPTQEEVNNAKRKRDLIDKKLQEKSMECNNTIKDIKNLENNYSKACDEVCKLLNISTKESITEVLNERKADLNKKYAENRANIKILEKAENTISELNLRLETETALLNTYDTEVKEYNEKLIKTETALSEMTNNSDYSSKEDAEKAINKAEIRKNNLENKYAVAKNEKENTETKLKNAETLLEVYKKTLPNAVKEIAKTETEYNNILSEKNFNDNSWNEYIEKYSQNQINEITTEINKYKDDLKSAETQKKSALKYINNKQKPDVDALSSKVEELRENKKKSDEEKNIMFNSLKNNNGILNRITEKVENQTEILKDYSKVNVIADLISGSASKQAKIDLETFVQRYYLQNILHSANKRFENMTGGQFQLILKDLNKAGKKSNEGLDLMVYSLVTGKVREIKTLSGGESFMAALSLALGMADQIKSKKGSINLDMMFIDEGFGSLDDRSRAQAVNVLTEMAGSDKLIGIISHVSELKQNIGNQLIVSKNESGSTIKWKID